MEQAGSCAIEDTPLEEAEKCLGMDEGKPGRGGSATAKGNPLVFLS